MKIEQWAIDEPIPYDRNPRKISEEAINQVANSLSEAGWQQPIVVNKDGVIIVGHTRLKAAQKLKMDRVPVLVADLTKEQEDRYRLRDNKSGEFSQWDIEMLGIDWEAPELEELGFDLGDMGIEMPAEEGLTDEDAVPEVPGEPTAKLGEIWKLGEHRLMCGDSTSIDAVGKLMDGEALEMVYTDPPYGISIVGSSGKVGGDNLAKNGVYAPVAGDESIDVATDAIEVLKNLTPAVQIIWGGNYYADKLENKSSWIVWDKRGDMASNNFADCELAWCSSGSPARIYKQIWSGMIKEGESGSRVHPTQKPIALAEWCIDNYGKDCSNVLDLFGGSGSTLLGCETRGKKCRMMELSPAYIDVIIKRWEEFTGKKAELIND